MTSRRQIALLIGLGALLVDAATGSAQNLIGIDPVKVKTIPMGPKEAAPVPPYPRTPTATAPLKSTADLGLPTTLVKTLRIDGKGHVVDKAPSEGSDAR